MKHLAFAVLALSALGLVSSCTVARGHVDSDAGPSGGDTGRGDTGGSGACTVGFTRCTADRFERCSAGVWTMEATCAADQACHPQRGCVSGDACTLAEIERSSVGCVYMAVDLPQPRVSSWPLVVGHPWSAQFGVAISNPWPDAATIRVTQNDAAAGTGVSETLVTEVVIAGNTVSVIPLPSREVSGLDSNTGPPSRSGVTNRAYRIESSLPVVAYQFNPLANAGIYSDDASLLVPVHSLDESYVAIGWPGRGADGPAGVPADNRSFLTIVAPFDGTRVRITPSTDVQAGDGVPALAAGESFEVLLNQYGVLNVQGADVRTSGPTDFTGTHIEADLPISVFSGVEAINISEPGQGRCCADHLEEQLLPRSSLGPDYVAVRSRPRRPSSVGSPEEDYFKVLALVDGTTVTTSLPGADASFTLGRGEQRLIFTPESFVLTASHPVVVAQFLLSGEAIHPPVVDPFTHETTDPGEQIGDPSFMTLPPVAQFRTEYRFLVPDGYENDYALIAAPAGTEIRIDGAVASCTRASVGELAGTAYEALHCSLGDGAHHAEADAPFGLVVEGWGSGVVSYGYTGGMDFEPINLGCVEDTECPGGEFCSGGLCAPVIEVF